MPSIYNLFVLQLKITTNDIKGVDPGSSSQLTIEGPSDMTVGLNIMDTALLLPNSENILRRTKVVFINNCH